MKLPADHALPEQIWLQVQHKWMHLENIFCGADVCSQLPEEAKKLQNITKKFTEVRFCRKLA